MGRDFPIPGLAGSMESSVFLTCWRDELCRKVDVSGRGIGAKRIMHVVYGGAAESSTDGLAKV